jgi:septum formation protein
LPGAGIVVAYPGSTEAVFVFRHAHNEQVNNLLVLASGSPRRSRILTEAGIGFEVVPPQVEEAGMPGETPAAMAVRLAGEKADEVAARVGPDRWVLGIDTVVAIDDEILGKPSDEADAIRMLLRLSGRTHCVYSGFAIVGLGRDQTGVEETRVTMRLIAPAEATAYSATGEPLDKAGAYAIQGAAVRFITAVEGSRRNVAGLPLEALLPLLADRGIEPQPAERGMSRPIDP